MTRSELSDEERTRNRGQTYLLEQESLGPENSGPEFSEREGEV